MCAQVAADDTVKVGQVVAVVAAGEGMHHAAARPDSKLALIVCVLSVRSCYLHNVPNGPMA